MLAAFEIAVLQAFQQVDASWANELAVDLTTLGSLPFAVILIIGLIWFRRSDDALLLTVGVVVNGLFVKAVKFLVSRPRPSVARDFVPYATSSFSFPSGHTSTAFVVATILAARYPVGRTYVFVLAGLVGITRLYLGVHYVTDVLVGAVIGYVIGRLVIKYRNEILGYKTRILEPEHA